MSFNILTEWQLIDSFVLVDFTFSVCNVSLMGLYIDRCKTNVSVLGIVFCFWYEKKED